ncbi:MAG: hypothetical protein Roseis2KO_07390 [Roseivirga sp.]
MNKEDKWGIMKFGSEELLRESHETLVGQLGVIEGSFKKLMESDDEMALNLYTLYFSVYNSCQSILILTPHYQVRDIYLTCRTIFELTLNIGYIASSGIESLSKAQRHMQQKAYRDLQRELNIESIGLVTKSLGLENFEVSSSLQQSLEEFTTKKGFEIRSWTGENVFKKIEVISDRYGDKVRDMLKIGLFNIYRHASEIAHGTLFSLFYIIGSTTMRDRPKDTKELLRFHRQHISLLILTTCLLIEVNLTVMSDFKDLSEEISKSQKLTLNLIEKNK